MHQMSCCGFFWRVLEGERWLGRRERAMGIIRPVTCLSEHNPRGLWKPHRHRLPSTSGNVGLDLQIRLARLCSACFLMRKFSTRQIRAKLGYATALHSSSSNSTSPSFLAAYSYISLLSHALPVWPSHPRAQAPHMPSGNCRSPESPRPGTIMPWAVSCASER